MQFTTNIDLSLHANLNALQARSFFLFLHLICIKALSGVIDLSRSLVFSRLERESSTSCSSPIKRLGSLF